MLKSADYADFADRKSQSTRRPLRLLGRMRRLPEECGKCGLIDRRTVTDLYVPHVLPLAFKQSLRVFQAGPVKEAKLHILRIGVHVRHGSLPSDPTSVSPLHGLAQLRLETFHEPSKRTDDRLVLWPLGLQVFIEVCIRLHFSHRVPILRDAFRLRN